MSKRLAYLELLSVKAFSTVSSGSSSSFIALEWDGKEPLLCLRNGSVSGDPGGDDFELGFKLGDRLKRNIGSQLMLACPANISLQRKDVHSPSFTLCPK